MTEIILTKSEERSVVLHIAMSRHFEYRGQTDKECLNKAVKSTDIYSLSSFLSTLVVMEIL